MNRKAIQESRMKGYFTDSAKSIIRGEGLKALSVRTVAERAGYSFATLYNYYSNLSELVFECVLEFMNEVREFVKASPQKNDYLEEIISRTKAFCNYFIQYPGIYEVIFTDKKLEVFNNERIGLEIDKLFEDIFYAELKKSQVIKEVELKLVGNLHKYMVIGILNQYLLRKKPANYKEFISSLEKTMGYLLSK